jgi:hypothetical protein
MYNSCTSLLIAPTLYCCARWSWKEPKASGSNLAVPSAVIRTSSQDGQITVNAPSVSSLDDDVKTKEAFKFSSELQRKAQNWIASVLADDTLFSGGFVAGIKSGVVLCRYGIPSEPRDTVSY